MRLLDQRPKGIEFLVFYNLSERTKTHSVIFWKVWLEDDPSKINKSKIVTLKDGLSKITTVKLQVLTRITNYFFGVLGVHIYTRRGSKQKVAVLRNHANCLFTLFYFYFMLCNKMFQVFRKKLDTYYVLTHSMIVSN